QADRAREVTEAPLETDVPPVLYVVLASALGGDGQRAVLQLDGDGLLRDAGKVERIDDLLVGLPDVGGREPALRGLAVTFEKTVHETAHLVLHGRKLTEGLPANKRGHVVPP